MRFAHPVLLLLLFPSVRQAQANEPAGVVTKTYQSWTSAVSGALAGRCATAICFGGDDHQSFALEPLAEVPLGKTFSLEPSQANSLASYVNNHDFSVTFSAGVRVWFLHDLASASVYLAAPLFVTDDKVRILGNPFDQPSARIRSPYPSFSLGLFADTLWLGFQYLELRNGGDDMNRDFTYPRNFLISQAWTLTVAISPITAIRNGLGTAFKSKQSDSSSKESAPSRTAQVEQAHAPDTAPPASTAPTKSSAGGTP